MLPDPELCAVRQHSSVAGAGRAKLAARHALVDIAQPVGAALGTWATVEGDLRLASRVSRSRTDYVRARDTAPVGMARTVHTEATARLADTPALADYGIDAARLDTLSAAIADYEAQIARPRAAIHERKAATAEIKASFADADRILRQRLDPLASLLAADWAEFAVDWRITRVIVDSG